MSSGFNIDTNSPSEESWIKLFESSDRRYCYYKTRSYGRLLFVKCVAPDFKGDLITCEALNKEFRIGYPLEHPNIMRYYKQKDDCVFAEYIEGKTLREMISEGDERLKDRNFVSKVCRQILEGLQYMHSQGVLHLDIKPENIMISRIGNNVKIIDFGCAYSSTFDSTPGFTFSYKAPEQQNGEINTYTDIYQLGKVMNELTCYLSDYKKWEKFIEKSTADAVCDRFVDDAEALAAIPGVRKPKTGLLWWIVVPVTVVFVYMFVNRSGDAVVAEPDVVEVDSMVSTPSENVVRDTIVKIGPQNVDSRDIQINTENRLSSKIKSFVRDYYDRNIRDVRLTPATVAENQKLYYEKCKIMLDTAIEYGQRLSAENPEYASFIEAEVMNVVSAQISVGQSQFLRPTE